MVGDVPGLLWTPAEAAGPRPLVLVGHGGGQHKREASVLLRATHLVEAGGYAVAAIDAPGCGDRADHPRIRALVDRVEQGSGSAQARSRWRDLCEAVASELVPDWRTAIDALQRIDVVGRDQPVGYHGVSAGAETGMRLVAADPRITAAVLGLVDCEWLDDVAAQITVPVEFLMQWDDEQMSRDGALRLFDALGSLDKSLHANPGGHDRVPRFELDSAARFFARHLGVARR